MRRVESPQPLRQVQIGQEFILTALIAMEIALFAFFGRNFLTAANAFEIVRLSVEVGLLASDLATELFDLLRQVTQFDAGVNGPFSGTTTPAQQTFLESVIPTAMTAQRNVNAQAAANGIHYQTVKQAMEQLEASSVVYKGFVANIEDVDIAEALARLNQNQVALQAAFQVTSTLNRLSLLDYLPIV